jgi:leucyl-tRNA synthetase
MEYHFREVENKWRENWRVNKTYQVSEDLSKPKYYVLDMFPYPSGSGLHVGHPLGYIASDIVARYKRLKGFNVLHPMGYDAFGLPAEQYAIQTGRHPADTTRENISRYREQLDKLGFSFDWSRQVMTSDPSYYKWTQWIFLKFFQSWYDREHDRARPLHDLISIFETQGNAGVNAAQIADWFSSLVFLPSDGIFSAEQWKAFSEIEKEQILSEYRLAYLGEAVVNWCPALGTVLANEEVKDGLSERGGYPVERKKMKQWSLRISAYADRLLKGLDGIDWTDSLKELQRNWIGKSSGALLKFKVQNHEHDIEVFTTRPDTIFGVSFVVLAPEHELVPIITEASHQSAVNEYVNKASARSERERMADVKKVSGVFTGAYVIHPFSGKSVPVWIAEYVLAGYGTGAVMAVPGHDSRDYAFAKEFNLPIYEVVQGGDLSKEAYEEKHGTIINSDFLNGLDVAEAIEKAIQQIESAGLGKRRVQYRLRDAAFGRQRYWGEPFPIWYEGEIARPVAESELPVELPKIDKFLPTESGDPPLARATEWKYRDRFDYEFTTMPGWAGSSWYFLRYMDPHNQSHFADQKKINYWQQIDLYMGGAEHATGHLLYFRFWTKFLFDLGFLPFDEPAKKLINQGMIQGVSCFIHRDHASGKYISAGLLSLYQTSPVRVDVSLVNASLELDMQGLKSWRTDFAEAEFITEGDSFKVTTEIEKMSKSKWNVVNPDEMVDKYGADCLRMYEMFLGPIELSKPWNTSGISGVAGFMRKFWRLFHDNHQWSVSEQEAEAREKKILHKTIRRITDDIERFSFNTCISTMMICVNELTELKCRKREILEPLVILIAPFAPHFAEELWHLLGQKTSVNDAVFPICDEKFLSESTFEYPVSFNGKTKFKLEIPLGIPNAEIEEKVLSSPEALKILGDTKPKKLIVVPGKIVNIVH